LRLSWSDRGSWIPESDPGKGYAKGHLSFSLRGEKLKGAWHLVRMRAKRKERKDNWLLIKAADEFARSADDPDILDEMPESVVSGKGIDNIAKDPLTRKWINGKEATISSKVLTPRQRARESLSQNQPVAVQSAPPRLEPAKLLRIEIPKGVRKRKIPNFIEPCLATASPKPAAGDKSRNQIRWLPAARDTRCRSALETLMSVKR
jgi:bifunctional non-homologous end joining protein LigD